MKNNTMLILYGCSGSGKSLLTKYICRYLNYNVKKINIDNIIYEKFIEKRYISSFLNFNKEKVNIVGSWVNKFNNYSEFLEKQKLYHKTEEECLNNIFDQSLRGENSNTILDTTGSFCNLNKSKINTLLLNFPSIYVSSTYIHRPRPYSPKNIGLDQKPISWGPQFIEQNSDLLNSSYNITETLNNIFPEIQEIRRNIYNNYHHKYGSFRADTKEINNFKKFLN